MTSKLLYETLAKTECDEIVLQACCNELPGQPAEPTEIDTRAGKERGNGGESPCGRPGQPRAGDCPRECPLCELGITLLPFLHTNIAHMGNAYHGVHPEDFSSQTQSTSHTAQDIQHTPPHNGPDIIIIV